MGGWVRARHPRARWRAPGAAVRGAAGAVLLAALAERVRGGLRVSGVTQSIAVTPAASADRPDGEPRAADRHHLRRRGRRAGRRRRLGAGCRRPRVDDVGLRGRGAARPVDGRSS